MERASINISQLQEKLQQLLKQHESLRREHAQQQKSISALRETEKLQLEELAALRQQQLILKASIEKMEGRDKKDLEKKINGYIRNIDKCISLLSHKPVA